MSHHRGRAEISVRATPAEAYALLTDVTRTPEWSREVYRCRWMGTGRAEPGARFRGWNRSVPIRWWRECEVAVADPPREFAFLTLPRWWVRDQTLWRFRIDAEGDGSRIVQEYELTRPVGIHIRLGERLIRRSPNRTPDMLATLQRIEAVLDRR